MKTSELSGAALDWAVAKCEGVTATVWGGVVIEEFSNPLMYHDDWALGGAIIERECIDLEWTGIPNADFFCTIQGKYEAHGTTPLIAAMRCYVASKLGNEVQIPEEITP